MRGAGREWTVHFLRSDLHIRRKAVPAEPTSTGHEIYLGAKPSIRAQFRDRWQVWDAGGALFADRVVGAAHEYALEGEQPVEGDRLGEVRAVRVAVGVQAGQSEA